MLKLNNEKINLLSAKLIKKFLLGIEYKQEHLKNKDNKDLIRITFKDGSVFQILN